MVDSLSFVARNRAYLGLESPQARIGSGSSPEYNDRPAPRNSLNLLKMWLFYPLIFSATYLESFIGEDWQRRVRGLDLLRPDQRRRQAFLDQQVAFDEGVNFAS